MPQCQLVLASGSPQRRKLLSAAGYSFDVVIPDDSVECGVCSTGGPAGLVGELALKKAADVSRQLAEGDEVIADYLLIACDTIAECQGSILGKPTDEEHARDMLTMLRGTVHRVYSGLCVWPTIENAAPSTQIAVTELRMDDISDIQLEEYLESGLWKGKAGAFGYQDRVGWLHVIKGSESNVIGLPMELLKEMLEPWKDHLLGN